MHLHHDFLHGFSSRQSNELDIAVTKIIAITSVTTTT